MNEDKDISGIFNNDLVEIDIIRERYNKYIDNTVGKLFEKQHQEKPIKQQFKEFLKREQCYYQFMVSWDKEFMAHDKPIKKPYNYIYYAFAWGKTEQYFSFWREVNRKWRDHLKSIGRV